MKQCDLWKGELSASVDNHNMCVFTACSAVDGDVKWSSRPADVSVGVDVSLRACVIISFFINGSSS